MKIRFLILTLMVVSCLAVAVQAQSPQTLKIPDEVASELQGEPIDFELSSPETTIIELSLTSDAFDPYLEILDAEGTSVAENDDGGEGTGSVLSLLAEADTVYTIRARSYSDAATGDFTLTVTEKASSEVSIEQPATTDLESKTQFFTFTGKAGDEVDFVVEAEDYDTTLAVLDAYGNELMSSDDGVGLNPFISDFLLPTDGTYILNLSAYSDDPPAASVQLSVRPTTIQDLAFDEALTSTQEKSYLRFEAHAGATYRIEIRATVPAIFGVEIKPRMEELSEVSSNSYSVNALIFEFTTDTADVYKLTINGISADYESTPYTTTITEVK